MKRLWPGRRRALRWIVMLIAAVLIGLYVILPVVMGVVVVFPYHKSVGTPPDGFEAVSLQTGDGVNLAAWYAAPANGAAIILTHGAGDSRESVRDYAAMLVRHGYGVLALDLRGHGESGGTTNRLGWQGTQDVGAAVAYLQARPEAEQIGGLGLSMGGEVLLGAASAYPAVTGIVADGATHRCLDELRALASERSLVRTYTARVMFATVQLLTGDDPPRPLLESMTGAGTTQFLLIAAGTNEQDVAYNQLFADTVGDRATLWIAPGAGHTQAFSRYPDEYEQRVIAFFDTALLGASAT